MIDFNKYTGHKNVDGVKHKIINQIPKHNTYIELFAGSASILSNITVPAANIILNDLDINVVQYLKNKFPGGTVKNICSAEFLKTEIAVLDLKTFIFVDPPYLHSTRPNNVNIYNFEMNLDEHIELITSLLQLKCFVMVIHPKCALYDEMFKDWRKIEIKIRYNRKTSIECLYMNYSDEIDLQCYDKLGLNCWDRQRIKRKGDRFVNKLLNLPMQERNYILDRIKEM